jgi:TonB-dependent SusC/RagA subfamily outer membrane receptor
MDNQDKLFDKIKEASQNAEFKDFPGMEKVWLRVEEKLDKKADKKTIALWKKIAVAASLLLLFSLGYQFLHSEQNLLKEQPQVVIQDKEKTKDPIVNSNNENTAGDSGIISKEEGIKILENKNKESVAVEENAQHVPVFKIQPAPMPVLESNEEIAAAPVQTDHFEENNDKIISKDKSAANYGFVNGAERESAKVVFAERKAANTKKPAPLVILNGNAMAHSDDSKKDKMMQNELPNLNPENVDSLVILDEPLYIIDGIYYSENDLFGNNPTSPYAPLDKQDIKTITILQDSEATSKYGEKGKKGVVIITTKTGRPTPKK